MTEVLIIIAPQSAKQAAMACTFAFVSLLAFELLQPHVDQTDSWLYRLVSHVKDFVLDLYALIPRGVEVQIYVVGYGIECC